MSKFILICAIMFQIFGCANQAGEFVQFYQVETLKPYDDVLAELQLAISENNFRITGHSRVGKVIRDRGAKNFPEYDTIQFCNLSYAQTILTLSPAAIRHMPCNLVLYQSAGKTIVRTHLLPVDTENEELNRFSARMNELLKNMIDFAVEE